MVDNFRFKFTFTSDAGNNIYIDDINLEGSVGINELDGNVSGFEVYPNPLEDVSTISFNLNSNDDVSVTIVDILGKEDQIVDLIRSSTSSKKSFARPFVIYF